MTEEQTMKERIVQEIIRTRTDWPAEKVIEEAEILYKWINE